MPKTNEELNAEIFKDMKRDGCAATAHQQRQAFVKWKASPTPDRYSHLAAHMNRITPAPADVPYPYHRCADALVQKLRKAGLMHVSAAKWSLTERGESFYAYVAATLEETSEV
jgi:hypothetical protein